MDRWSDDPVERIEWHVDQIRQAVLVIAAVIVLGVVIAVVGAMLAG